MATSEYREAVALALKHGWYEVKAKGGHHVFEHQVVAEPAVRLTITENLTDNGRAYKNVLAQIKRVTKVDSRLTDNTEEAKDGETRGVRQAEPSAPVLDRRMRQEAEEQGAVPEASPDAPGPRGPAVGAVLVDAWLGEPCVEVRGGLPAGSRPAWSRDGSMCGWVWPTGAGVGVRRRGRPATGIHAGEAVLPGPFPLPGGLPVVPQEVGPEAQEPATAPEVDPERPGRGPLHREPEGETLAKIRALLGEDPRLAEMEADRDRWKGEAGALAESLARVQADLDAVREMLAGIGRSA